MRRWGRSINRSRFMIRIVMAIAIRFAASAALAQSADSQFQKLLDDEWEWTLREFPMQATRVGDNRFNDRMPDYSEEAIERRRAHARELVTRVRAIDRTKLSPENRVN